MALTQSLRERPYRLFFGLAFGTFLVAHLGFDVLSRMSVGREPLSTALREAFYYLAIQPVGSLLLLAPFALLGWMAASLASKKSLHLGAILFCSGAFILCIMYLQGHLDAQQALQHSKWTASALSVGLLPFESVPVLALILLLKWIMGRKGD